LRVATTADTANPKGEGLMKKFLLAASAVVALTAIDTANAADMALKAVPPPAPVYSWTGWYAGVNVGGSFGQARDTASYGAPAVPFIPGSTSANLDGVIGGGQIGYNMQSGSWLFGLEADIQGSSERSSALSSNTVTIAGIAVTTVTGALNDQEKLPWFGTARGRIGLLASPTWLFYVTGGLAYGEIRSTESLTVTATTPGGTATAAASATSNTTRAGWTIGGGVEGVISGPWTAKIEYLYMDFGTFNNSPTGLGLFTPLNLSTHVTDNVVRVGLNYHFH
jgi:outer membrane immunogenic protein